MVNIRESEETTLRISKVNFRYVRIRDLYLLDPYPPQTSSTDILTHTDLLLEESSQWEEVLRLRDSSPLSVDAGTISRTMYDDDPGGEIYVYSHSIDLKLPLSPEARYQTARDIQQFMGRPLWRVRSGVDVTYERAGGVYMPRRAEDRRDPLKNMRPFRRR